MDCDPCVVAGRQRTASNLSPPTLWRALFDDRYILGGKLFHLFLDEFGHEDLRNKKQMPVFGYGGILLPADQTAAFATYFFDQKILANLMQLRTLTQTKERGIQSGTLKREPTDREIQFHKELLMLIDRLKNKSNTQIKLDQQLRYLSARHEVKGDFIFAKERYRKLQSNKSKGYRGSGKRLRHFLNFSKMFARSIKTFNGEVFYVGFHRSRIPSLKHDQKIHVRLLEDVLHQANAFAVTRNTTVKIWFDRHHTDGTIDKGGNFAPGPKGRLQYARQLTLQNGYFENITEPIFTTKSHWSQCVQAADWTAYLLGLFWSYKTGGRRYAFLEGFYDNVGLELLRNACDMSYFKTDRMAFLGTIDSEQKEFDFAAALPNAPAGTFRPYKTT